MERPYLILESTGPLLFDGLEAVCWLVRMTTNITAPRIINTAPGQVYTFVFTQNGVGGHTMNWPANCINAVQIDPAPSSITTVSFVGDTGGLLYASIAPTGYSTQGPPPNPTPPDPTPPVTTPEVVFNGGFEEGMRGWTTNGNIYADTTVAHSGSTSARSQGADAVQTVPLIAGFLYSLSAWVMTGGSVTDNGSLGAGVSFSDGALNIQVVEVVSGTYVNAYGENPGVVLAANAAVGWTKIEMHFTVTVNAETTVGLTDCYGTMTTENAPAWLDDISIVGMERGKLLWQPQRK